MPLPQHYATLRQSPRLAPQIIGPFLALLFTQACSSDALRTEIDTTTVAQPIIHGTEAIEGKYPWMIKVPGCTASLISPHFVLSAGHCFAEPRNQQGTLEGVEIVSGPVRFGHPDLANPKIQSRDVKKVHLHPEYAKLTLEEVYGKEPYDHALLELAEPIVLEQYLQLPTRLPLEGEVIIAAGWGLTESGGGSQILRETTLKVQPNAMCFSGDETRFCSQGTQNTPASNIGSGDSGGPVFVAEGTGHMLLGVNCTSNGQSEETFASHASSYSFLSWILEVAARDFVDECAEGLSNCSKQASCSDIVGGFECLCLPGYEGDGVVCTDVDECNTQPNSCRPDQVCTNTDGAFECACPVGLSDLEDDLGCRAVCGDNLLAPGEQCDFPAGQFQVGCVPPESLDPAALPCTIQPGYTCERTASQTVCAEIPPLPEPKPLEPSPPMPGDCGAGGCSGGSPGVTPQIAPDATNDGGCQLSAPGAGRSAPKGGLLLLAVLIAWIVSRRLRSNLRANLRHGVSV